MKLENKAQQRNAKNQGAFEAFLFRSIMGFVFFTLTLSMSPRVFATDVLALQSFLTDSGTPLSMRSLLEKNQVREESDNQAKALGGERNYLVLFWAGWCVPCKEELTLLSEKRELFEDPRFPVVIAINVDDSSGWAKAQSFLASLNWKHISLRDESGQFFYNYRSSGLLPYSVLLNSAGEKIEGFDKIDDSILQNLVKASPTQSLSEKKYKSTGEIFSGYKKFKGESGMERSVLASAATARFLHSNWEIQARYDYLKQEGKPNLQSSTEDELGSSYIQWSGFFAPNGSSAREVKVRLGDDQVSIFGGKLASVQSLRNFSESSSLLGAHLRASMGPVSFWGFGGKVREALFPSSINPTQDVSLSLPKESMQGGQIQWKSEFANKDLSFTLAYINYHREKKSSLGYSNPFHDSRFGSSVYWGNSSNGFRIEGMSYQAEKALRIEDSKSPYLVHPHLWWTPQFASNMYFSLSYLEYQSLPPRVLIPVLIEDPGLPLSVLKKKSIRFSPRFSSSMTSWYLEPVYVWEQSTNENPFQKQDSFGLSAINGKKEQKLQGVFQKAKTTATDKFEEHSFAANSPLIGPLAGQVGYRKHSSSQNSGESRSLILGLDVSSLLKTKISKFLLQTQWTHQTNYFLGFSGIQRKDLGSLQGIWSLGSQYVKVALGSEPGGVVCTNGVCTQRPPMNGLSAELNLSF